MADVVFLLDVDNTLLDNDQTIADLRSHLKVAFGGASASRYWAAFEALRAELGVWAAAFLAAVRRGGSSCPINAQLDSFAVRDFPSAAHTPSRSFVHICS